MPPIRVLVVDDSVVTRKVLCEALASDPEIEIAGSAADGNIGLAKIALLKPDIVTLDVELPVLSGLATLAQIRKLYPKLAVIMFSTLTEHGAEITLDALALGASDYATKPQSTGSVEETRHRIQLDLLPKLKALCPRNSKPAPSPTPDLPQLHKAKTVKNAVARRAAMGNRIEVLAIGTSTGGPNALADLLPGIASDFPVPIVIVQHMPPPFTRLLAERLQKQVSIRIREGEAGQILKPGEAWIAPGDFHMTVTRQEKQVVLALNQDPPENSCRPAVDVLFRSVAGAYGAAALVVVLTGMGSDGVRGSQKIREAGGQILVQDEATSVVWGMPGQVVTAGLADAIYPLSSMAAEIERRVRKSRAMSEVSESATKEGFEGRKSSPPVCEILHPIVRERR